jgi:hypothetical protein
MEFVNNMMMMMMMTIMTTTKMPVHSSSDATELYREGAQSVSWPLNYLEVFHGFSQSQLVSEQCLEIMP